MKLRTSLADMAGADAAAGGELATAGTLWDMGHIQDVVPAKIQQVEGSFAMLVEYRGQYVHVRGRTVQALQCLEFADAVTTHHALSAKSRVSEVAELFKLRVRGACTDSGSNVLRAESLFHESRPGWLQLHFPCKLHKIATGHEKTFSMMDDFISKLINTSLSLQSSVHLFRRALRDSIFERSALRRGVPDVEAVARRRTILQWLLPGSDRQSKRQAVTVDALANGDWSRADRVEHYVGEFHVAEEEECLRKFARKRASVLLPHAPRTYPRSRWNGALPSVADIAIMVCCHGLFGDAYRRWCKQLDKGDTAPHAAEAGDPIVPIPPPLAVEDGRPDELEAPDQDSAEHNAAPSADGGPDASSWRQRVAKARVFGMSFVNASPEGHLLMMAFVLNPLQALRNRQFELAGRRWDRQQELRVARAAAAGRPAIGSRDYRVLISATCTTEKKFFNELLALMAPTDCWRTLPNASQTVTMRSLAFRLLSRAGAVVHELLVVPQRGFPWRLFELLRDPGLAVNMSTTPICQLDRFSYDFVREFPELGASHVVPILHSLAVEFASDTGEIETLHASIRRRLLAATHNTHAELFSVLGSEWIALQAKSSAPRGHVFYTAPRETVMKRAARERRGGGGGYRAYVSDQVRVQGRPFDRQPEFASEWSNMSDETRKKYITDGAQATRKHRVGEHAFGPTRRKDIIRLDESKRIADSASARLGSILQRLDDGHDPQLEIAGPLRFEAPSHALALNEQDVTPSDTQTKHFCEQRDKSI